jgi:hypothetical protein
MHEREERDQQVVHGAGDRVAIKEHLRERHPAQAQANGDIRDQHQPRREQARAQRHALRAIRTESSGDPPAREDDRL